MGPFWAVITIMAGVSVLALLHFLAAGLRNATYVHDMRVKVATVRKERLERLKASAETEVLEVEEAPEETRRAA